MVSTFILHVVRVLVAVYYITNYELVFLIPPSYVTQTPNFAESSSILDVDLRVSSL